MDNDFGSGNLHGTGHGTHVATDHSVVDWRISIDCKKLQEFLERVAQEAVSPEQEIRTTISCTIHGKVREDRALPPIWELLPGIPKIGCGNPWHYAGNNTRSSCPSCNGKEHAHVNSGRLRTALKNFDRRKFPKQKPVRTPSS